MKKTKHIKKVAASTLFVGLLSLAGCGGSSSSNDSSSTDGGNNGGGSAPQTISGVAASGLPIEGTVTVKGANGQTATSTIDEQGNYSVNVAGLTGPFMIKASGVAGGIPVTFYSAATQEDVGGNINVTPLTDLMVSNATGDVAENAFNSGEFNAITGTKLSNESVKLKAKLQAVLDAMGVDSSADLLKTHFVPLTSALDKVLDVLKVTYDVDTKVATISNLTNNQSITQNITTAASENGTPTPLNATGTASANADLTEIRSMFQTFSQLFASNLPTTTALGEVLTSGFSNDDETRDEFIHTLTTEAENIGLRFTDFTLNAIDYTDSGNIIADVNFIVRHNDGTIIEKLEHFKLKKINGLWKWHGNQRVLEARARVHETKSIVYNGSNSTTCLITGVEFNIHDYNLSNSDAIDHVTVTGPGLPAQGVRLNRASEDQNWTFDSSVTGQNTNSSYYVMANSCNDAGSNALSAAQISALPKGASYVMSMYDNQGNLLTSLGRQGTYRLATFSDRPMTLSELASVTFPTVTNIESLKSTFGEGNNYIANIEASGLNPNFDSWMFAGLSWNGGAAWGSEDSKPSSSGVGTASVDVSAWVNEGAVMTGKDIRVETRDALGRRLMTQYRTTSLNNQLINAASSRVKR